METDRASNNGSGPQRSRPSHGRTSGPTRRSTKGQWTTEEDEILRMAVQRYKGKNWKKIAECFRDRTDVQCLHRWQKVLNPDLVKGPWSKEEDEKIIELVNKYGPKKWSTIAQNLPGRIGKQCRERWHNHLNPNINKDAWTQEEEVILIRAHQMHGNKWAELTKYLPGRTDNAIKNHWNSSVRKKLDMYMSSGMLQQFQDVPLVSHSNHLAASSSSRGKQSSEDDIIEGGVEVEEASECSHGSTIPSMSQSINNTIALLGECRSTEDASLMPFSAEDYRPVFQEPTFSIPEVPCEQGDKFPDNDFSIDWGIFEERDWQQKGNDLPDVSLINVGQESSGLFWLPPSGQDNHESAPFQQEPPIAQGASTYMVDMVPGTDNCHIIENCHIIADSDFRIVYPEGDISGCCPSEIDVSNMGHHTSTFQIHEGETSTSQPCFVPSEMLGNSLIQPAPFPTQLLAADDSFVFGSDINMYSSSHPTTEQEHILPTTHDDFINTKESGCSPCEDDSSEAKEYRKLVPANDFVLDPSQGSQCHSSVDKDVKADGQEESGNLCYEPPRFPSLDMPFFSCDLIQPGSDMQLEYSPLGIRQLMLSSFKTWDSPSRDTSPDAVLKSAAKTFTGTPSILKKRNRDFMSPSSVKSGAKKLENSLRPESFSHLASERLEVMFDDCVDKKGPQVSSSPQRQSEASCKEKENVTPACMHAKNQGKVPADVSDKTITEEEGNGSQHYLTKISDQTVGDAKTIDGGNTAEMGIEISGNLVEHDLNDLLLFSPDRCGVKTDTAIGHGNKCSQHLDDVSKQAVDLPSSEPYHSVLCSPQMTASKDGANLVITTSLQTSTTPSNKQVGNSGICVAPEFNAIFVETTPFKRAMESPSAWKSPWFFDCFAPGPKVDTDITIEDIGYFLSPGDHSYDAIGLMKQLGEQTAGAFAEAQEVLGNETPESLLKAKCSMLSDAEKENHYGPNIGTEEHHHSVSASNVIMREKRTLDFNDCGTPPSAKESRKFSSNVSFSSASSYLLKGCR